MLNVKYYIAESKLHNKHGFLKRIVE